MDQLDEIRSKIDIVSLVSEYFPIKKAGRNYKAACPFHGEKTPSFMVSPERQIFKCFGCGEGGDIFGFVMRMEGMEFGEALKMLAKRAGVKLASYKPSLQEDEKERMFQVNHLAAEFYHYILTSHLAGKKALAYLLDRGIKMEAIKTFKIGYAPALWQSLQKYLVSKKNYKTEDLTKAGLVTRNFKGEVDFFRDRVMFPLRDHRGNFVGFAGRVVGAWDETGAKGPKYINTPETLVYQKGNLLYGFETTKNAIKAKNQAIIVEGELDLISSYQAGIENVVAIKGSSLTEFQAKLIKRFCENMALALDMDTAGDKATWRGIEIADKEGLNIRVVRLPEGKDPDELARKSPEALIKAIEEAIPAYDFFLDSAFSKVDPSSPEGKKKIGSEVLPIISKISDEIVKAHYLKKMAKKLGVPEEAISEQMKKIAAEKEISAEKTTIVEAEKESGSRREMLEKYLLILYFQGKKEHLLFEEKINRLIKTPSLTRIMQVLADKAEKKKFSSTEFAKSLPPELVEIFNSFYLWDLGEKVEDDDWFVKEEEKTLFELGKLDLKEKVQEVAREMARAEEEGNTDKLTKLEEEFRMLSTKITKLNQNSGII
jgi:DNA primase